MKGQLLIYVRQEIQNPTADQTMDWLFRNGLVSVKAIRDYQIRRTFEELAKADPSRPKTDIMYEISAMDDVGRPSFATVRNAVYSM